MAELSPVFSDNERCGRAASDGQRTRRCELPGCEVELGLVPGREGENKYCCRRHRNEAHRLRQMARHGW